MTRTLSSTLTVLTLLCLIVTELGAQSTVAAHSSLSGSTQPGLQ